MRDRVTAFVTLVRKVPVPVKLFVIQKLSLCSCDERTGIASILGSCSFV